MMKDQFANYVIQKVLETSNEKQRKILLSLIRVHLDALKKYTYGKHIVVRFEQLSVEGAVFVHFQSVNILQASVICFFILSNELKQSAYGNLIVYYGHNKIRLPNSYTWVVDTNGLFLSCDMQIVKTR